MMQMQIEMALVGKAVLLTKTSSSIQTFRGVRKPDRGRSAEPRQYGRFTHGEIKRALRNNGNAY